MAYKLITLYSELTWAPYWKGCTEQQQNILDRAAEAIKQMMLTLDEIRIKETVSFDERDDPQVTGRGTFLTRIGERANKVLKSLDT